MKVVTFNSRKVLKVGSSQITKHFTFFRKQNTFDTQLWISFGGIMIMLINLSALSISKYIESQCTMKEKRKTHRKKNITAETVKVAIILISL